MSSTNTKPVDATESNLDARPNRRTFTSGYKARILEECDTVNEPGGIGEILRREGLYSSHLVDWRRVRSQEGLTGLEPRKPGPQPVDPAKRATDQELDRLRRENASLLDKLRRAEIILEAQKKLAVLLASLGEPTKAGSE